jgi:hypothetical protein
LHGSWNSYQRALFERVRLSQIRKLSQGYGGATGQPPKAIAMGLYAHKGQAFGIFSLNKTRSARSGITQKLSH